MPIKPRLSRSSKKLYRDVIERIYGDRTPDHLPRGLDELPGSTTQALRAALQHYWKEHGDKPRGISLAQQIETVPARKRFRIFPGDAGSKKFEDTTRVYRNPRAACVILSMLAFGFRVQEMLASKRGAFESALKTGFFIISEDVAKGAKARAVPIGRSRDLLIQLLGFSALQPHAKRDRDEQEHEWDVPGSLLVAPGGSFGSARNMLARDIKEIAVGAGLTTDRAIGWSPHMLRHIFSSRLARAGCPHAMIKFALGHEMEGQSDVTLTYLHVSPEDLEPYMPRVRPLKEQRR